MSKIPSGSVTIAVPEKLASLFEAIVAHVGQFTKAAASGDPDFAKNEKELYKLFAVAETASVGEMLAALDPKSDRVSVGGRTYRRLNIENAGDEYVTLRGSVRVPRGLYREEAVRNGPTVVPMALRAGIVEGQYTPAAGEAVGFLAQLVPSREADQVCRIFGVLPRSRSSHYRVGTSVGDRWDQERGEAEDALVERMEIPPEAATVAIAADRASMPMAEPRERTADDVANGVEKPITVAFRMAYTASLTMYDREGKPLTCVRYARVPADGALAVEESLRGDLDVVLRRRPDLTLVTLGDGAPEIQGILDRASAKHTVRARLVDFWHLAEYLGQAARAADQKSDVLARMKIALTTSDDAIDSIENELRTWTLAYDEGEAPDELVDALRYISNHRERLRYASAHAQRLPIGSGMVEATGKTIIGTRMKRTGARWTVTGAQALMGLRALATSSPERWYHAMQFVLASYKAKVRELPPKVRG